MEERGRREGKRERELPGRNKLARNERQIASELSARSPDVIEAAMPFLLRLRVSLCFLPSVSLTFSYFSVRPIDPLTRSLHLRSSSTGPPGVRKETEAELVKFPLLLHLPSLFRLLTSPPSSALRTTDHFDGRLSTHQGPTSPLPTD